MSKITLILSLLNKREKRQLVFVFFAMLIMGFMEVVGVGSITPFMSIISDPEIIETNRYLNWAFELFRFETHMDFIFAFGLAVIIFLAINNAARAGISFIIRYYSGKRLHSVSMRLMERYLRQPYIYFLNVNTSDISKNILSEVSTFINKVLIISLQLVTNAIVALAIIALLVAINPLIALAISLILTAAYVLIFTFIRKYLSRMGDERARVNSLKYKFVSEAFGGIKDVKLLGREGVFLRLFSKPSLKFAMNDAVSEVVGESPKFIMETLAFGGILGLILIMLGTGDQVEDFLPLITVYAFGGYRLLPALQKVFSAITKIRYNLPIVEILHHDYYSLPETGEKPESQRRPEALSFTRTIELENIRFRYPNTEEDVIKNQSLSIRANTSVGFVGPTGCGKTTTIDIILGLLEAQSGSLRVDSREITAKNRSNWQANLGYVPQSIFLVDDSIRKNIAFGIAENEIDEESVIKAAQVANLHDFIMNDLDRGYETMVGERGVRLSGGQKQRIGIARAVYHDPSVLILDEATSALDGLTENAIMDAIHNLSHKKTILMIAHRLTTVRECDEIFIMEKGVIVDRGTYDELIQRNESFRKMAEGSK
jgi:ABC-type multidrug transport system fused ATPase/permease subunit